MKLCVPLAVDPVALIWMKVRSVSPFITPLPLMAICSGPWARPVKEIRTPGLVIGAIVVAVALLVVPGILNRGGQNPVAAAAEETSNAPGNFTMTMDFSHYGVRPDIRVPQGSEVYDVTPLMEKALDGLSS